MEDSETSIDYYITTVNQQPAVEDVEELPTTTVIVSVDRRGSKLRKRKKSKRRKKRNTLGGIGSNSDNDSKFGSTGSRRKCARRAISLNERDLMKRANLKSSFLIKQEQQRLMRKESGGGGVGDGVTNSGGVRIRGSRGRRNSSKRRNRAAGMVINSGDYRNLVAMQDAALPCNSAPETTKEQVVDDEEIVETSPPSPPDTAPAVDDEQENTMQMEKDAAIALLDQYISDIEARISTTTASESKTLQRSSPCLERRPLKDQSIKNNEETKNKPEMKQVETKRKASSYTDTEIVEYDFNYGLLHLHHICKLMEQIGQLRKKNELLQHRVLSLEKQLKENKPKITTLKLIKKPIQKSAISSPLSVKSKSLLNLTTTTASSSAAAAVTRDDVDVMTSQKKKKTNNKHKKLTMTKSEEHTASTALVPLRISDLKREAEVENVNPNPPSNSSAISGGADSACECQSQSSDHFQRKVELKRCDSTPTIQQQETDHSKKSGDENCTVERSKGGSFYKRTVGSKTSSSTGSRLFSWAGTDSWRSKSAERAHLTGSDPTVNKSRNPLEWNALQESFPTQQLNHSDSLTRSHTRTFKPRRWFTSKHQKSNSSSSSSQAGNTQQQNHQPHVYLPDTNNLEIPDKNVISANNLASQTSLELNNDDVKEFTSSSDHGNGKEEQQTTRQNSQHLTCVREDEDSDIIIEETNLNEMSPPVPQLATATGNADVITARSRPPARSESKKKKKKGGGSGVWRRSYSCDAELDSLTATQRAEKQHKRQQADEPKILQRPSLISPRIPTPHSGGHHKWTSSLKRSTTSAASSGKQQQPRMWKKIWSVGRHHRKKEQQAVEVVEGKAPNVFTYGLVERLSRQFNSHSSSTSSSGATTSGHRAKKHSTASDTTHNGNNNNNKSRKLFGLKLFFFGS